MRPGTLECLLASASVLSLVAVTLGILLIADAGQTVFLSHGLAVLLAGVFQLLLLGFAGLKRRADSEVRNSLGCSTNSCGKPTAFEGCLPGSQNSEEDLVVDCSAVQQPREAWPPEPHLTGKKGKGDTEQGQKETSHGAAFSMLPSPNNRLKALEVECNELLEELTTARQELTAVGERERRLQEVCRRRSASMVRLASHLTRAQVRPQQVEVESQVDSYLSGVTNPENKSVGTMMTEASQELLARCREVAVNTDDVQEEAQELPSYTSQQPAEVSQNAPTTSQATAMNAGDVHGAREPVTHSPAARIAELATGNPAVRDAVLAKLRSVAQHPVEQKAQCEVGMGYSGSPVLRARPTVQTAITRKIAESAAEAERWHKAYRDLSIQLQRESAEAQRWREEHQAAAAKLEAVGRQVDELGACVQRYAARAEQAEEELKECQKQQEVRNVVIHVGREGSPELCFRWVDDCKPFSASVGSMAGVQQLKRSLAGVVTKPAELIVGPPPADWRIFLQLRLRQHEQWEPALLRLSVPSEEGSDFVGLIWSN